MASIGIDVRLKKLQLVESYENICGRNFIEQLPISVTNTEICDRVVRAHKIQCLDLISSF
jgi:hypothetical protein